MICYFNSFDKQLSCGITEKEFDVIEELIRDEYGYGYAYKQRVNGRHGLKHEMVGLISFGITKYGLERCRIGLETWTALNKKLYNQIWDMIGGKDEILVEKQKVSV